MFLWYIIIKAKLGEFSNDISFVPIEYTPLIVWIAVLSYIFFPSFILLNGSGRKYMFNVLLKILLFWKTPTFITNWATDQLVSFVNPLKDFYYFVCFYIDVNNPENVNLLTKNLK